MDTLLLTPSPMVLPSTDEAGWIALDDSGEWEGFSQPVSAASAQDLWESHLVIEGMYCAACSFAVEAALKATPGVQEAAVNAATGRARVMWSSQVTKPSDWMRAVSQSGYRALPASDAFLNTARTKQRRLAMWRWLVAGFCMMQVMMYAMPAYVAGAGEMTADVAQLLGWASWVLSLPVLFFSCGAFFGNAWRDLKQRRIGMDLPVTLGILITFFVSSAATFEPNGWWGHEVYFDSMTMFVFFLLTGRWLELRLRDRTAGALEALMRRLPDSVERRNVDGSFTRVAVRRLLAGDVVRVLPGEAFPADGQLLAGNTTVDEALLTGESRPLNRVDGDAVIAGSHNLSSPVTMRVEQLGPSTRYAQIVALMERVSVDKPRLVVMADRIARPFLLIVLFAAGCAALFWWNTDPGRALMAAVAVLVVTCPCALSLAAPTAMLSSAGAMARGGVLVRRLQALEALSTVDTVVFDKTGTLTQDRMRISKITVREGEDAQYALWLAAAMAAHSLHPVSRALVLACDQPVIALDDEVLEVHGQGLQAHVAGKELRLGSARFCGFSRTATDVMQVFLADAHGWFASFDLEEAIRTDAKEAIAALKAMHIKVEVLSGDRQLAVQRVAGQLDIDQVAADCSPQDKLAHMQALQGQGAHVAMVGDGLNDGPVLAAAHVSVAIGDAVPLAQAQADFVVLSGQLDQVVQLFKQARSTMRIVKQNLIWAAVYNALSVPLALMGWLPAWLAGLGMAISSLIVIMNAARLALPVKVK